jgi:hypothetical protein
MDKDYIYSKTNPELVQARSVEIKHDGRRKFSQWKEQDHGRQLMKDDPDSFKLIMNICVNKRGWYFHKKYLDEYVEWLLKKKEPINKEEYGLLIFKDDKGKLKSYIRKNHTFRSDQCVRKIIDSKCYIIYETGTRDKLVHIREQFLVMRSMNKNTESSSESE